MDDPLNIGGQDELLVFRAVATLRLPVEQRWLIDACEC